jgi:beta-lactamase regulating signal transducer with metallopeptidase domain
MGSFWMGCVSNLVLASLLALVAWTAGKTLRSRPAVAHAFWLLVLLKLITPPLVQLPLPAWATESMTLVGPNKAVMVREEPKTSPPVAAESVAIEENDLADWAMLFDLAEEAPAVAHPPVKEETAPIVASLPPTATWTIPWSWLLLGLWGTGTLSLWCLAWRRVWLFQRLLRLGDPADERVRQMAAEGAKRLELGKCPAVICVPAPISPMVWAWWSRPRLVLPSELVARLSDTELSTLLLHELAHVKRGDHWIRWLEVFTLGLHWWNPLAWWAKRELQQAEEACCDAWVVWSRPQDKGSYVVAMVRAMDYLAATPAPLPAGASGLGQVQLLKRRIHMLNHGATTRALPRGTRWVMLAVAMLVLPVGTLFAAQEEDPPMPPGGAAGRGGGRGEPGRPAQPPQQPGGRGGRFGGGPGGSGGMVPGPQAPLSEQQKQDLLFESGSWRQAGRDSGSCPPCGN